MSALCAAQALPASADELDALLSAYFTEPDRYERTRTSVTIVELTGGSAERVADALGRVQLWPDQPPGFSRLEVKTAGHRASVVEVLVPEDYEPTNHYPLILALHDHGGDGQDALAWTRQLLGRSADEYIIAAPTDCRGTWLMGTRQEAADPAGLLAELRRRYHLDTERVYAVGRSMGGHAAFALATLYADEFAAAVALSGTLVVPYPQVRAILLPNLANTPVLAVWHQAPTSDASGQPVFDADLAPANRQLLELAEEMNVPITGIELVPPGDLASPGVTEQIRKFLHTARHPAPGQVSHWFRYPAQGRCGWLRQAKFSGLPWQGTELDIATRLPGDFDQYVTDTIKDKLAYIGGRIDGQTIEVTTHRTDRLNILLNDGLIDLDQPITLKVDGTIRFQGRLTRKISTLLETAYEDWDFQRLFSVRLVVGRRSPARQE